jgi:hypothetical protein
MRECGGGLQLAYITDNFAKNRGGEKKKKGRDRESKYREKRGGGKKREGGRRKELNTKEE